MTDNFYYEGKFFEKEEDFWAYVKEFNERQATVEDFDNLFNLIKKDILINFKLYELKLTNGELKRIFEEVYVLVMKKVFFNEKE